MKSGGGLGRWIRRAARGGGLVCFLAAGAQAQGANVGAITAGPSPALFRVTLAVAGFEPNPVIRTSTVSVRATKSNKPQQVLVSLNAAMPAGLSMTLGMTTPSGATDPGPVTLDATARALMTDISNTTFETETLTYTFAATAAAGVVAVQSRTVTFTITAWP